MMVEATNPSAMKPEHFYEYAQNSNTKRYKARLVAEGFTQREGIDYNGTVSLVSSKGFIQNHNDT